MIIAVNFQLKQPERTSLKKIRASTDPLEALIFLLLFFQASSFRLLNLEIYCDDHSLISSLPAAQI